MEAYLSSEKAHIHRAHPRELNLSKPFGDTPQTGTKIVRLDWVAGRSETAVLEVLAALMRDSLEVAREYAEHLWEHNATQLDSEACRHLRMLLRACDHLESLIELLSRFERAGRLSQITAQTDLLAVAEEIRHRVRGADGRSIDLEGSPELGPVAGDLELLKDLLLIIFQLGSWLMPAGCPRAEIRLADSSPAHVCIRISATRLGNQESSQPAAHLLESASKDTRFAIALAIARRIVHSHHGQLWLECPADGAVIFHVVLPSRLENIRLREETPKPHVNPLSSTPSPTATPCQEE
jgi:light-regulated signal transduction histidine kinase (bacteriophytochrome)